MMSEKSILCTGRVGPRIVIHLLAAVLLFCSCKRSAGPQSKTDSKPAQTTGTAVRKVIDDSEGERYLRVEDRLRMRQQRILDEFAKD